MYIHFFSLYVYVNVIRAVKECLLLKNDLSQKQKEESIAYFTAALQFPGEPGARPTKQALEFFETAIGAIQAMH